LVETYSGPLRAPHRSESRHSFSDGGSNLVGATFCRDSSGIAAAVAAGVGRGLPVLAKEACQRTLRHYTIIGIRCPEETSERCDNNPVRISIEQLSVNRECQCRTIRKGMKARKKVKSEANSLLTRLGLPLGILLTLLTLVSGTATFVKLWQGDTDIAVRIVAFCSSLVLWTIVLLYLSSRIRKEWLWAIGLLGLVLVPVATYESGNAFLWWEIRPSGKIIVLVADIAGPDSEKYRVTDTVLRQLRRATSKYDDVRIVAAREAITELMGGSEKARSVGKKYGASIVVWGYYQRTTEVAPVTVYCEMLKKSKGLTIRSDNETLTLPLAELETLRVVSRVSDEMKYVALLVVGLSRYEREDFTAAIDTRDQISHKSTRGRVTIFSTYAMARPDRAILSSRTCFVARPVSLRT